MGTTLTGTTPQDTYDSLIKVTDNGPLSGTAKYLSDGLGNDSVLALSTSKVGIATNTPAVELHVETSGTGTTSISNVITTLRSKAAGRDINIQFSDGTNQSYVGSLSGAFYVATGGATERMRITSAGLVGIAKTTPSNPLHIGKAASSVLLDGLKVDRDPSTATSAIFNAFGGSTNIVSNSGVTSSFTSPIIFSLSDNTTTTEVARIISSGITFNGDTAAANALDDYEEGTFTPNLTGSVSNPTYTATAIGNYTKIGRQVVAQMDISIATYTAGSGIIIISLPFTVSAAMGYFQCSCYVAGVDISGLYLTAEPNAGNAFLTINQIQDDAAAVGLPQSAITAGDLIRITATYFV